MVASKESSEVLIIDRAGRPVDTSGPIWRTNDPTQTLTMDWRDVRIPNSSILDATRSYVRHLIRNYSVGETKNNWSALQRVWDCPSFQRLCRDRQGISFDALSDVKYLFSDHERYRFHFVRKWYRWCCSQGYASFLPEVALRLDELIIGGNVKGEAVLSVDPEKGPLSDVEIVALINALGAARLTGKLSLKEQVAIWLCIALGQNSGPLSLLREEDFEELTMPGSSSAVWQIKVPRHKKGDPVERRQFRTRKLNGFIAGLIKELISENRSAAGTSYNSYAAPLLRRETPRVDISEDSPIRDYRYHYQSSALTELVARAVAELAVISPRTGRRLQATVRRFRYTYATRLVREGASSLVVADALDHTDLQNIQVYFDIKSDIVPKLDRTLALELGPIAQAFLGQIVRGETDAVRGGRRDSRVYHADKKTRSLDPLGTCGSFSFCNLFAPIACYTCFRFQPWMDAPHDKALQALLDARQQRIDAGLDDRMVTIFDNTIFAIADVIHRIDLCREEVEASAS